MNILIKILSLFVLSTVLSAQNWGGVHSKSTSRLDVSLWGAVADSATESGAAINQAINSVAGRAIVELGIGVYIIEETITLRENIELIGQGPEKTKLVLKDGANVDLIQTKDFVSQTGTNIWTDGEGIHRNFAIRGMTLDGNRDNNLTNGYGIRIYGKGYILQDLIIQNTREDGIYSEAGSSAGVVSGIDMPEAYITNIRVFDVSGDGLDYRGPHDGLINDIFVGEADSVGVKFVSRSGIYLGGAVANFMHIYSCSTGVLLDSTALKIDYLESESNFYHGVWVKSGSWINATQINLYKNGRFDGSKYSIQIDGDNSRFASGQIVADNGVNALKVSGGWNKIFNVTISGAGQGGIGVDLSGSRNVLFVDVANFSASGGKGIRLTDVFQSRVNAQISNCDTLLHIVNTNGANMFSFQFGAAGTKVLAGNLSQVDNWIITGTASDEKILTSKIIADTLETIGNTIYAHPQSGVDFYFSKTKKAGSAAWLNFGAEADVGKDAGVQFFRQTSGTAANQTKVIIHDGSGSYAPIFEWRGNGVHLIQNGAYRQEVINDTLCVIKTATADTTRLVPAR